MNFNDTACGLLQATNDGRQVEIARSAGYVVEMAGVLVGWRNLWSAPGTSTMRRRSWMRQHAKKISKRMISAASQSNLSSPSSIEPHIHKVSRFPSPLLISFPFIEIHGVDHDLTSHGGPSCVSDVNRQDNQVKQAANTAH
jgi:hypothetical protein